MRYSSTLKNVATRYFGVIGLGIVCVMSGCQRVVPQIPVSQTQSLVMDANVFSAGIVADNPRIIERDKTKIAQAVLSNDQDYPVTIRYRFYWYNIDGLDVLPFERTQKITLAAHEKKTIESVGGNQDVRQVRLHLFL